VFWECGVEGAPITAKNKRKRKKVGSPASRIAGRRNVGSKIIVAKKMKKAFLTMQSRETCGAKNYFERVHGLDLR